MSNDAGSSVTPPASLLSSLPPALRSIGSEHSGDLAWSVLRWLDSAPSVASAAALPGPAAYMPGGRHTGKYAEKLVLDLLHLLTRPKASFRALRSGHPPKALLRASAWRHSAQMYGTTSLVEADGTISWATGLALPSTKVPALLSFSVDQAREACTAVIISQDRRDQLLATIENILGKACANVVVVDGGSADGSVQAAKRAGAHVVSRPFDNDFASQRNFGVDVACREFGPRWILRIDSDELLPAELSSILLTFMRHDISMDALYGPMVTFGPNLWDTLPLQVLLHRPQRRWLGKVHERIEARRPVVLPIGTPPLLNVKTLEQVWEAVVLYDDIKPGAHPPEVVDGYRRALAEQADPSPGTDPRD